MFWDILVETITGNFYIRKVIKIRKKLSLFLQTSVKFRTVSKICHVLAEMYVNMSIVIHNSIKNLIFGRIVTGGIVGKPINHHIINFSIYFKAYNKMP